MPNLSNLKTNLEKMTWGKLIVQVLCLSSCWFYLGAAEKLRQVFTGMGFEAPFIIKITSMPPGVYIYPALTVCVFVLFLWCWASGRWETKLGKFVSYFPILPLLAGVLFIADTISGPMTSKPVIYLYPEKTTEVSVRVKYNGALTHTWPPYGDGWKVTAHSDGMLVNHADGREYSYLFWEGEANFPCDFSSGFVVKGSDTGEFLREKLAFMGLTPREYNEFIVYWLPLTEGNAWNLISFQMVEWGGSEIR